ncbi:hypothetical protein Nepgr_010361 [Nepenthes gracilis]|uniref:Uncharacterized protein n=1 Tax=Nepenthes gracilis TaxID=150966 RepID=A0AAD3XLB3_NEPGR|nr:hypothetical protein Nepgr_010361 [Nepenthes gracilis]
MSPLCCDIFIPIDCPQGNEKNKNDFKIAPMCPLKTLRVCGTKKRLRFPSFDTYGEGETPQSAHGIHYDRGCYKSMRSRIRNGRAWLTYWLMPTEACQYVALLLESHRVQSAIAPGSSMRSLSNSSTSTGDEPRT